MSKSTMRIAGAVALFASLSPAAYSHPGHGSHGGSAVTPRIIPRGEEPSAQTTKRADVPVYGDLYGRFRLGHFNGTYFHETQNNHIKSTDVKLSAGLSLGTRLLANALDLSLNLGFERRDNDDAIETLRPALLANWRMARGDWGSVSSNLLFESAMGDEISELTVGVSYGTPAYKINSVSLFSGLSLAITKPMEAKTFQAEIIDELSFREDIRTMPVSKDDPSLAVTLALGAQYAPRMVKGLTLKSQVDLLTEYDPYFKVRTDLNGDIAQTSKDTVATKSAEAKVGAAYQFTKRVGLSSDLTFRTLGFFERPRVGDDSDDTRFESLTALTVTLF